MNCQIVMRDRAFSRLMEKSLLQFSSMQLVHSYEFAVEIARNDCIA